MPREALYAALIEEISELIVPETDTPGAKAAGVPAYVQAVVGTHYTAAERDAFMADLAIFDEMAHERGARTFTAASPAIRQDILSTLDSSDAAAPGYAIWRQLRAMVIFGYYTSEAAMQELHYDPVPGKYDGDVDFEEIGRAWLTTGI